MGWATNRMRFSDGARILFFSTVGDRRRGLKLPGGTLRGSRFLDDEDVLARLESSSTEVEFMECPGLRVDSALIDAAQADSWYSHEKDYGMDDESGKTEIAEGDDE